MKAEVVNADALTLLAGMGDGTADLVVLDPDYQDWRVLLRKGLMAEALRVLRPSGNVLAFTKEPFDFVLRCEMEPIYRREIAWTFANGGAWCSKRMPLMSHQKVFWGTKGDGFYFNPRTGTGYPAGTKGFKRSSKVFGGYRGEGREFVMDAGGPWIRDHYHFNKPKSGDIPAKPRGLVDILVRCFCPGGGLVVDPFAGSGVFGVSSVANGRRYIGSEVDPDRCERAREAIAR